MVNSIYQEGFRGVFAPELPLMGGALGAVCYVAAIYFSGLAMTLSGLAVAGAAGALAGIGLNYLLVNQEEKVKIDRHLQSAFEALDEGESPSAFIDIIMRDRDAGDELRSLPLVHKAAWLGESELVERLLRTHEHEHDLYNACRDYRGYTPLHIAAMRGHVDVVAILLEHGAEVQPTTSIMLVTPLHLAIKYGHQEVMRLLLDKGADPNCRAYMQGVQHGHESAEEYALDLRGWSL